MLHLPNIAELEAHLLKVPALIDRYAARDAAFSTAAVDWLLALEDLLKRNRLPLAAEVAVWRGDVVSREREEVRVGSQVPTRSAKRLSVEAAAERALRSAVESTNRRIALEMALIGKAEESVFELVIVGRQLALLPEEPADSLEPSTLAAYWAALSADQHTRKYCIYCATLVGKADALIMLDQALTKR